MHIGIWELLLILAIVMLLFGTKRLRSIGTDLGASIRGFRDSMKDSGQEKAEPGADKPVEPAVQGRLIEGETIPDEADTAPLRKQQPKV